MIITLKGADFSKSNVGTLSTWMITKSLKGVTTTNTLTSVDKDGSYTATFKVTDGYELYSEYITMGGVDITEQLIWSDDTTATLTIEKVTGNVYINIVANSISGEEEEPENPDVGGDTGGDELAPGTYTYNNSGYVLATTGKVTTGNTWIHSDFIPINQLTNGEDGKCVRTFVSHGTVAAIAYYTTKDDFDSWMSSLKVSDIDGATSATAEKIKELAPSGCKYVVFSTNGANQTLSVTVGSSSGDTSDSENPATSGINYYENPGFISVSTGQVTNTTSDWIHSDFIAIDDLVDDSTLGHCIGKFTGHSSVADIAFYSSNSFDSFIIGKSSAGSTKTLSALQSLMTELGATNATHIVISTDKTKNQLYASLK